MSRKKNANKKKNPEHYSPVSMTLISGNIL